MAFHLYRDWRCRYDLFGGLSDHSAWISTSGPDVAPGSRVLFQPAPKGTRGFAAVQGAKPLQPSNLRCSLHKPLNVLRLRQSEVFPGL